MDLRWCSEQEIVLLQLRFTQKQDFSHQFSIIYTELIMLGQNCMVHFEGLL